MDRILANLPTESSPGCDQRHTLGNWNGSNERRLQEMVQFVISKIEALMQAARDNYSVDPVVFLVIYLGSAPFFYYSLFRMIRALAKRVGKEVMLWSAIFLCANVAPFLYVLFFGRNLPWWVYGIIALLIGQGVFSLVIKLRGKPAAGAEVRASDPEGQPGRDKHSDRGGVKRRIT